MKFGDIVINEWAGDRNPEKVLLIINHGKMVTCLSRKGKKVCFYNDKHLRLTKVGELEFSSWNKFIAEQ